jgi:two-component system, OmpR family, response regulator VicR
MDVRKILIVDDDPSIRKSHLILLDIMMPEMDGFEVCRRIRNSNQVPIIMLSAREGEGDGDKPVECGANDYITKPFFLKEILNKVKSFC